MFDFRLVLFLLRIILSYRLYLPINQFLFSMFLIISKSLSDECFEFVTSLIVFLSDGGPHLLLKLQVVRLLVHPEVFNAISLGV